MKLYLQYRCLYTQESILSLELIHMKRVVHPLLILKSFIY